MSFSLVLDIIFCVLSLILIIRYTRKGAVRSILSFFKTILAVAAAIALRKSVAEFLDGLFMKERAVNWVHRSLVATANGTETDGINFVELYRDTPSFFTNILSRFGIDLNGLDSALENIKYASDSEITELSANIGSSISMLLSTLLAVVSVFIIALIVFTIVVNLLDKVTHLPGLNLVNRLLGAGIGAVISLTIIIVTSSIISVIVEYVGPIAPKLLNDKLIADSIVLRALNDSGIVDFVKGLIH